MKKSGFFRGMFDGLRSTVSQPTGSKLESEIGEQLKSDNLQVAKIVRHGFPYQPTALSYDPIQRLIAIGTQNGSLRILGRPGVDIHVQHVTNFAVIQIIFIINEGSLITLCADDSLHLWNFRAKPPEIIHSLKFQKERITFCHLSFQSKWLYIGTERGNVHVVNIESFSLSGYVINWNKAIEISKKTHPGSVVYLCDCPIDNNKLLIGFDSGYIVFWDLRNKSADFRINYSEGLKSISWHHEGRQFICSHNDGSLTTWNIKGSSKPVSILFPHAKVGKPEICSPIYKAEWTTVRNGESFIIFSGGLPYSTGKIQSAQSSTSTASSPTPKLDKTNENRSLTVIHGKTTTVLELEHDIIDFVTLCESPWESDFNEPYAIVVLLYNDLVVVDLTSQGYPCFQNPYAMDLHDSPVTYCLYLADCPSELIPAFYSVGYKGTKRSGFSEKEWPISGGEWGTSTLSYPEIIITGHADGSLKFWDTSSVNLQLLYKLKTAKLFEKPKNKHQSGSSLNEGNSGENDDPFAIEQIAFCPDSRYLCVAGASSHVIVFKFNKQENQAEIFVLDVHMRYDYDFENVGASSETEISSGISSLLTQTSAESHENYFSLKVKKGHHKKPPGFQPELLCLTPWIDSDHAPFRITSLSINAQTDLLAYGTENSLIIVDLIQKCVVFNVATSELYGSADPFQRTAKSKKISNSQSKDGGDNNQNEGDRCKSPTSLDEMNGLCLSPTSGKPQPTTSQTKKPVTPEMKRTRSQGTRYKLQKMHTIQSMASTEDNTFNMNISLGSDKIDSSFSRSRSSSSSSLENINNESVLCLYFAETYSTKSDATPSLCLWVGTSLGSVLVINIILPDNSDNRVLQLQEVTASPSGSIYRLKGTVLCISFMDFTGSLLQTNIELNKNENPNQNSSLENKRSGSMSRTGSGGSQSTSNRTTKISPTSSSNEMRDSQFAVLVSEKQARIVSLPSQTCVFKQILTETSFAVRADVVFMKNHDCLCLAIYLGTGNIQVYSLPSLRLLIDVDFLPLVDVRIARTICFSNNGHGMYLTSPSEIAKFTISSSFCDLINDLVGTLYISKEIPEQPKPSFLKGLFGGGTSSLDREELFGEVSSGKPNKAIARHIPGTLEQVKQQQGSLGAELSRVREGLTERGERLNQIEDKTAKMMSESEVFSSAAHSVMLKYRDKKWYQF